LPPVGLLAAQFAVQVDIFGAFAQGALSLVPLFESLPVAEEIK